MAVVSCSYNAGMLLCCAEWHTCVLPRLMIVYFMGGKLVFDWDRLQNFLITHDRLVGNRATNTICQSWVSHVQMQCTIALVSDEQTAGKVSVTPNRDERTVKFISPSPILVRRKNPFRSPCNHEVALPGYPLWQDLWCLAENTRSPTPCYHCVRKFDA